MPASPAQLDRFADLLRQEFHVVPTMPRVLLGGLVSTLKAVNVPDAAAQYLFARALELWRQAETETAGQAETEPPGPPAPPDPNAN